MSPYPPARSLIRVVESFQRKWRDIVYEPMRVVFQKDGVSRARNVLVYKSAHNLVMPCLCAAGIVMLLVGLDFGYRIYFLKEKKIRNPEIDGEEEPLMDLMMLLGFLGWVTFVCLLVSRYVIRIYYNDAKKEFTLVTYNLVAPFFTMTRVVRAGSGRIIEKNKNRDPEYAWNPLSQLTFNCKVDGSKYLLHPQRFKYPVYFNVLFGYDDPEAITKLADSNTTADKIFKDRADDKFY